MYQLLYGPYNLNDTKCIINTAEGERDISIDLQRIANSNFPGSTIVNKRLQEKPINITGVLGSNDYVSLITNVKEFDKYMYASNKYLRIARTWLPIMQVDSVDDISLGDDAINKTLDLYYSVLGESSCSFDADVSVSANNKVSLSMINNPTIDITPYQNTGNLEFWIYIPDVRYITSLDLKIGSDSTNYLTSSGITTQYDGSAIQEGWNYFSVAIQDMVMVGNQDFYKLGKIWNININYSSDQTDLVGFKFGGLIWQYDNDTRNYKGHFEKIIKENNYSNISQLNFECEFLCSSGQGESTDMVTALAYAGVTTHPLSYNLILDGTFDPLPVITLTLTSVTNAGSVGLTNLTTGDNVLLTETWANGDIIVFDFPNKQITRNNVPIDYDNVLPRWVLGINRLYIYFTSTAETILSYTVQTGDLRGY
jgi:hypothetical protein